MRLLWRYMKRLLLVVLICAVALLAPIAYVETACKGSAQVLPYKPVISAAFHRPETRTLMTYPEWDIVHAYEDYAHVLKTGDPHDFGYLRAVSGFWSSLCSLTSASAAHGDIDGPTKQMVYVIGVSFTAELLLKAVYEETLGRLATRVRGDERAALDDVSAAQAGRYAKFLQQVPWYKWPFQRDRAELHQKAGDSLRDRERRFALGVEYGVKAAYANVINDAVAQVGQDALSLRMVVRDVDPAYLQSIESISIIAEHAGDIELEAPRYRALTLLLQKLAQDGVNFVEIAGNDDIMFTVLSETAEMDGAIYSTARQGRADHRHLILVKVSELAGRLRAMSKNGQRLEHIHDY